MNDPIFLDSYVKGPLFRHPGNNIYIYIYIYLYIHIYIRSEI